MATGRDLDVRFGSEAAKGSNVSECSVYSWKLKGHRILKRHYVFRYDIEISHRYRHCLSPTKAIKSFEKKINTSEQLIFGILRMCILYSDVVIRTKGKYDWRREKTSQAYEGSCLCTRRASFRGRKRENVKPIWSFYDGYPAYPNRFCVNFASESSVINWFQGLLLFTGWINAWMTGLINPWPGGPNGTSTGMNRTRDPVTSVFKGLVAQAWSFS